MSPNKLTCEIPARNLEFIRLDRFGIELFKLGGAKLIVEAEPLGRLAKPNATAKRFLTVLVLVIRPADPTRQYLLRLVD